MIKSMKPLSLIEAKELVGESENKQLEQHLKRFIKLKKQEAGKLRKELEELENLKIKGEYIVKIIDLLPEDASDVNKIFVDVSLDENEIKQILEIVGKYR